MAPLPTTFTLEEKRMSDFWDGKRVVVTGGAGMVGSQLTAQLLMAGAEVTVLDDFSRGQTRHPSAQYVVGDAGREGTCRDVFKSIFAVFNLAAAVAGVEFNQRHQSYMFESNLRLLQTPLKIAAEYGVERFLQTSSVCIYSPQQNHPCREEFGFSGNPTVANEGYSLAKRMGEKLAEWYAEETGIGAVIVRPSNIYGPRDYFDERAHVIPAFIRKCLNDDEIVVNGSGNEEREFIFTTDVARGMMAAVEHGKPGAAYNLGTQGATCTTIRNLLVLIQNLTNSIDKPVRWTSAFDGGDSKRWSDCRRANEELDWHHEVTLDDGLKQLVDWYVREGRDG